MAPVVQLARLVWSGSLFTDESWSCSLHFNGPVGPLVPALSFEAALKAWFTRAGSRISDAAKLEEIKFNSIDPITGRYALPVSNNAVSFPVVSGVSAAAPGQLTLAITTRTALARGRAHAGRFYPPTGQPAVALDASGREATTVAQSMAQSAADLIVALNLVDPTFTACVFSRAGQVQEPITHVAVGRVYDTIRSRRTSISEDYQEAAVPA